MEIIKARRNRAFWNCPFHGKLFTSALRCNQTEIYRDYKIAPNSLTHLLDYIVMQIRKVACEKGYSKCMEVESREAGGGEGTIWNISFLKAKIFTAVNQTWALHMAAQNPAQYSAVSVQCGAMQCSQSCFLHYFGFFLNTKVGYLSLIYRGTRYFVQNISFITRPTR